MLALEQRIGEAEIVHSGPELILIYAQLRAECERIGHALSQRHHDADRWVAATAVRLQIPLVSNDQIFRDVSLAISGSKAFPQVSKGSSVRSVRHGVALTAWTVSVAT